MFNMTARKVNANSVYINSSRESTMKEVIIPLFSRFV